MPPETDFEREARGVPPLNGKEAELAAAVEEDIHIHGEDDDDDLDDEEDEDEDLAQADKHTEKQLDHGLKETFPASDPVSINPGAD